VRSDWELFRRRVAIAGRVLYGGTGKPVGDAEVVITAMPTAFKKKLEAAALAYGNRWKTMLERPDKTRTRPDGVFYFLDVPDGKYSVSASIPSHGSRCGKTEQPVTVSRDSGGDTKISFVKCTLPPTLVRGKVTGSGHKSGVSLARVRVKGSGERAFTDAQGQYTLAGIEPGKRTLLVSAQGYRAESQAFTLGEPGASQTLNFALTREGG
jgi:hypothetical protein